MAEGHVCGQYTTHEWGGGVWSPRNFLKFNPNAQPLPKLAQWYRLHLTRNFSTPLKNMKIHP